MSALPSYVQGRWQVPDDDGVAVPDAVTGEEVARVSSAGIDMARRWSTPAAPGARRCGR